MKKKLIAGMTSAAVIASLSAPAFAANFADVKGTPAENAAGLLKALGVVNGDVNGKFNPDATITRAEFAKIAVLLAGYKGAADAYGTNVTPFSSDVKAGHWAAGYIQVAKDTGLVKGYDQWNFGPTDNVKYEEVLAVALRILGYNDSLPGAWPSDYVVKGTQLGLSAKTQFQLGKAATRGDVAAIAAAALSETTVKYSKDTESFVDASTPAKDLIDVSFGTAVTTTQLLETDADGKAVFANAYSAEFSSDYSLVGGANINDLFGHDVKFVKDADGKIVYVADATDSARITNGKVAATTNLTGSITLDGTSTAFSPASGALYYVNGFRVTSGDAAVVSFPANAKLTVIKNAAGQGVVYYVNYYTTENALASDNPVRVSTTDTYVYYNSYSGGSLATSDIPVKAAKNVVVTRNGAAAKLADIQKGDALYLVVRAGELVKVDAFATTVTGEATKVVDDTTNSKFKVTINGTEYVVDTDMVASSFFAAGTSYTVTLGKDNAIVKASVASANANTAVGYLKSVSLNQVVTENGSTFLANVYSIFQADGTTKAINVPVAAGATGDTGIFQGSVGDLVAVKYDSTAKNLVKDTNVDNFDGTVDGTIIDSSVAGNVYVYAVEGNNIHVGPTQTNTYIPTTSSTVFIDISNKDANGKVVPALTSLANIKSNSVLKVAKDSVGYAKYVFVTKNGSDVSKLPTVAGAYVGKFTETTSTDTLYYFTVKVNGVDQNVKVTSGDYASSFNANDLVMLKDNSSGAYALASSGTDYVTDSGAPATAAIRTSVNTLNKTFTAGGTNFVADSSTVFYLYDISDDTIKLGNFFDLTNTTATKVEVSKGINLGSSVQAGVVIVTIP